MSTWSMDWSNTMPTTQAFQSRTGRVSSTDWTAYNDAVNQYNAAQQEKQYNLGYGYLQQAANLYKDNGAYDLAYKNAKSKYMSGATSDLVSRGMANVVNAGSMSLAYDKEVGAEYEIAKQNRLAQALQAMAQYTGSYQPVQAQNMAWSRAINWPREPATGNSSYGRRSSTGRSTEESPFAGVTLT